MTHRSRFTPDDEPFRKPQTDGLLGPPGRKPPTAVATATPRPPRKPGRPGRYSRLTVMQRVARGMLSALLIGSGTAAIAVAGSVAGITAGLSLGGLGVAVAYRLVRRSREGRHLRIVSKAKRPRSRPGDSGAASA